MQIKKGAISAYIGEEGDEPDPQWRLPFLYDYTDGGSEQDYYKKEEKDWKNGIIKAIRQIL